jgi:hypothetical protein
MDLVLLPLLQALASKNTYLTSGALRLLIGCACSIAAAAVGDVQGFMSVIHDPRCDLASKTDGESRLFTGEVGDVLLFDTACWHRYATVINEQ